jgi:hypothetical protein
MVNPGLRSFTKHLIVFLSFFVVTFTTVGQKYSIGVKAGGMVSWPAWADRTIKDTLSAGLSTGYNAAMTISFPMKNQFDLVIEGGYSKKGRKVTWFDGTEWTNISTFKFIDMGMFMRKSFSFRLEKNIPATWYVNIGPEVSYWLSGAGRYSAGGDWYNYTIDFDKESSTEFDALALPNANRWLFGLGVGGGIIAPLMNNQTIGVELRFSYGHTYLSRTGKISNEQYPLATYFGYEDSYKCNIKSLTLSVSYSLNFDVQRSRRGKSTLDKKVKSKKPSHRFR